MEATDPSSASANPASPVQTPSYLDRPEGRVAYEVAGDPFNTLPWYRTTGTGNPACSARYWDASLRSDGGISGPPYYSIR